MRTGWRIDSVATATSTPTTPRILTQDLCGIRKMESLDFMTRLGFAVVACYRRRHWFRLRDRLVSAAALHRACSAVDIGGAGCRRVQESTPFAPALEVNECLHTTPFGHFLFKPREPHGLFVGTVSTVQKVDGWLGKD